MAVVNEKRKKRKPKKLLPKDKPWEQVIDDEITRLKQAADHYQQQYQATQFQIGELLHLKGIKKGKLPTGIQIINEEPGKTEGTGKLPSVKNVKTELPSKEDLTPSESKRKLRKVNTEKK